MDTRDLESKKINNEQQINEGFSGENIPADYDPADAKLTQELETDKHGNTENVHRARNTDRASAESERSWDENESLSRGIQGESAQKIVERKDMNYDSPNRYPASHPENQENRGNIKLDGDE